MVVQKPPGAYLLKNHNSQPWAAKHVKRFFTVEGFHLLYYDDENMKKRRGEFDLRNVIHLRPSLVRRARRPPRATPRTARPRLPQP